MKTSRNLKFGANVRRRKIEPTDRLQSTRDGAPDPLGRTSTEGFVVAVSDRRGGHQAWGDQIFLSQDIAASTAKACCIEPFEIRAARRITYMTGRRPHPTYRSSIIISMASNEGTNA